MARREADAAKAVMMADVEAVRHALTPAVIAGRASVRAATAVDSVNREIRARPGVVAAALGLIWLLAARHRLSRMLCRTKPVAPTDLNPQFPPISPQVAGQEGI
ncbi:hypothetical protein [Sphingomonas sp. 37zxx]|uniref:hypothetical protein n=1 Tax=Sphingomonas sp. 37zxx TaxID=1550073 RepID=UPI00053BFE9C|nr:hypothetical protein [Sphingomonas sp. 37zxx]